MTARHTRFPVRAEGLAAALAEQPVLLEGMKVQFDTKVALYPATLKPGERQPGANGRRGPGPNGRGSRHAT